MNELDRFRQMTRPYTDIWTSMDIRSIIVSVQNNWINLFTRVVLKADALPLSCQSQLPSFPGFRALHNVRPAADLQQLLRELENGTLRIDGNDVLLAKVEAGGPVVSPPWFYLRTARRMDPWRDVPFIYPSIVLTRTGESIHNLLANYPGAIGHDFIDWSLRALDAPYDGLNDLLASFLDLPRLTSGRAIESACVDIVAPVELRIAEESRLDAGRLELVVEGTERWKTSDIAVGGIEFDMSGSPRRTTYRFSDDDREPVPNNRSRWRKVLEVPGTSTVIALLRARDNAIDQLELRSPISSTENRRIVAYEHFDPDLTTLRDYLAAKGNDRGPDFEVGVGLLLHFCGFDVAPYGRVKKLQGEIDLVAFTSTSDHVLAAECTIAELDVKEKLSKLSRRVKELSERLAGSTIVPLIFTALPQSRIARSDLEKATTEHIGVIGAEGINDLLQAAIQRQEPAQLLTHFSMVLQTQFAAVASERQEEDNLRPRDLFR